MADFPETKLYRRINNRVPRVVHRQKVGSATDNGTADFWYSGSKADLWVEYKWLHVVPRAGIDPLTVLSPLQARWLNLRRAEGRRVLVIIGTPTGCAILINGEWNEHQPRAAFDTSEADVAVWLTEYLHVEYSEVS